MIPPPFIGGLTKICEKIGSSLINLEIPLEIVLFLRPVQREVVTSAIKWMAFFCNHVSDFSFPDINNHHLFIFVSTNLWDVYITTVPSVAKWSPIFVQSSSLLLSARVLRCSNFEKKTLKFNNNRVGVGSYPDHNLGK